MDAVAEDRDALDRLRDMASGFGPRAARRGRQSVRTRVDRLEDQAWQIGQCAVAAALAWWLARGLLGHPRPFFAPVAAIVSLGVSYGARVRRVVEVTIGVAVGVGIGDLFVHAFGSGVWQVGLVVLLSMSIAVLVGAGTLMVTQAGVQGVIVTTLLPNPSAGLGRWLDAVVGGLVALLAATLVPATPLRRPRILAAQVVNELADLLREAARSAQDGDVERAAETLERARSTERSLIALRDAAAEALDVTRSSPLRRRHRPALQEVVALSEPLDRAVRNARVLVRRVAVGAWRGEPVPPTYADLVDRLALATDEIAAELSVRRTPTAARPALDAVAQRSAEIGQDAPLSASVVLAQVRSIVVDLLQVTGLEGGEALERVPPERRGLA